MLVKDLPMQFAFTPEGYATPNGSGGYDYVYQYKDHLEGRALRKGPVDLFSEGASLAPGK